MSNWDPPPPPEPDEPRLPTPSPIPTPSPDHELASGNTNPFTRKFWKLPIWGWLLIVGAIIGIGAIGGSNGDNLTTVNPPATQPFADLATTTPEPTAATVPTTTLPATTLPATVPSTTATTTPATEAPTTTTPPTTAPPSTTTQPPAPPPPATWTMSSVIDGDTLDLSGPDGTWRVRLIGINSPEDGECFAEEAADALRAIATGELVLLADVSDEDQFDRKLRYVETTAGVDVGAELVRGGYAISRRYEPDTARNTTYDQLQDDAEAAGLGLWAADACGPATAAVSVEITIRYDADGDDNQNKNDEWVRFTNTGSAPLDLDRWVVADESASHRYTFRNLTLAPNAAVTLYTGCGADTQTERYWCNAGSAIWNNTGDTVFLRDPNGNNVATYSYDG